MMTSSQIRANQPGTYGLVDNQGEVIVYAGKKMLFRTKAVAKKEQKRLSKNYFYGTEIKEFKRPFTKNLL